MTDDCSGKGKGKVGDEKYEGLFKRIRWKVSNFNRLSFIESRRLNFTVEKNTNSGFSN